MSEKKQTWQDELDTLLARLVDEELSTTDTKRLNEILNDNPAARDQYHAYMDVHEALQEQFSIPDFTALDKVVTPEPEPSYRRPILAMAALVMIGFFINFLVQKPTQSPVVEEHAETPWALLAQRELDEQIGWKWVEDFTDLSPPARGGAGGNNNPAPATNDAARKLKKPAPKRKPPKL